MDLKISVVTRRSLWEGADANIYCRFTDIDGNSSPTIWLKDTTEKCFENGSEDHFLISLPQCELNDLYQCDILRENAGVAADWTLDSISVTNKTAGTCFMFNFDKTIQNGKVTKSLASNAAEPTENYYNATFTTFRTTKFRVARRINAKCSLMHVYTVTVNTADRLWAGTTDAVFINIKGDAGETGRIRLKTKGQSNFERGFKDVFRLELISVGTIEEVTMYKYGADDFFISKVSVIGPGRKKVKFAFDDMVEIVESGIKGELIVEEPDEDDNEYDDDEPKEEEKK